MRSFVAAIRALLVLLLLAAAPRPAFAADYTDAAPPVAGVLEQ